MPERFSCASSSLKPNGSMRCSSVRVPAHNLAILPVFGGISGSTSTMCMRPLRFVKHFPKNEPLRWRAHPGFAAVARIDHFLQVIRRKLSAADLHQRAHDTAAHLVEEPV